MVAEGRGEGSVIENENKSIVPKVEEEVRSLPLPPTFTAPTDLIARIFSQLDCVDLLQCSLVCKQWYTDSAELREGWKNEYLESRNMFGLGLERETHPPSTTCSIRGQAELVAAQNQVKIQLLFWENALSADHRGYASTYHLSLFLIFM
ncbi:uncharacterized protein LOC122079954 isoform X2 [Macadamia integrifolia]|uniref:uncharacterized protein LOC122079954 isoform X2 n=1 Tax=Macadamia integrifolia TaxID=60698 RepID=UPI001C4F6F75|nr:uncharacterized protein LOC122079954 isoform X2 [Macadamia integrifolia]